MFWLIKEYPDSKIIIQHVPSEKIECSWLIMQLFCDALSISHVVLVMWDNYE
jgi:hypothetical protein